MLLSSDERFAPPGSVNIENKKLFVISKVFDTVERPLLFAGAIALYKPQIDNHFRI